MKQADVDKIITEARGMLYYKAGSDMSFANRTYDSWEYWGEALRWAQKSEWWDDFTEWFIKQHSLYECTLSNSLMIFLDLLTCITCDDRHGSFILAEFIIEHPKLFKEV